MAAGLGMLGLAPRHFWSMTPKELDAALRGRLGLSGVIEPPSSQELSELMGRFPDGEASDYQDR